MNIYNHLAFVLQVKPKNIQEALIDDYWVMAMHKELNQFKSNNIRTLSAKTKWSSTTGTRWIFKNKLDENGLIIRNKARLISKRYN